MYLLFALVAVPTLLCMLLWVGIAAYRICHPERPAPFVRDPVVLRRQEAMAGEPVLVGVREIREDQRRAQEDQRYIRYYYTGGYSHGVPAAWIEELWRRRN